MQQSTHSPHPLLERALGERYPLLADKAPWLCQAAEIITSALHEEARSRFLDRFQQHAGRHIPMSVQHLLISSLLVEGQHSAAAGVSTTEERKSITDAASLHFRAAGEMLDPAEWQDASVTGSPAAVMARSAFRESDAASGFSLAALLCIALERSPQAAEAIGKKLLELLEDTLPQAARK